MIKVLFVDDEKHAHENFRRIVRDYKEIRICAEFYDGESLLKYLRNSIVDCVFLDIEIPGRNGLVIANEILELSPSTDIVFLTAYQQYAVQAFEVNAIDYLIKPVTSERFQKTVERLLRNQQRQLKEKNAEITCFGAFYVKAGGRILQWKNQRAKELLAFLVHKNGVPVSWDQITEVIWRNLDHNKAQINLHSTMYRLKKHLIEAGIGHILVQRRGNYSIKREDVNCDYFQFLDRGIFPNFYQSYLEGEGYDWAQAYSVEIDRLRKEGMG
ncbi:MAG: response regulator [Anaerolineaceae bacterium]|nr:response regulator [Anaerolineaceae bacterium]